MISIPIDLVNEVAEVFAHVCRGYVPFVEVWRGLPMGVTDVQFKPESKEPIVLFLKHGYHPGRHQWGTATTTK